MKNKCVCLISENLPAGLAANAAVILGISAGDALKEAIGADAEDRDGLLHSGVIQIPVAVLKAPQTLLADVMNQKKNGTLSDCTILDFTSLAQSCKTYPEFLEQMKKTGTGELSYAAVLIYGPQKTIRHISGELPLYSG